MSKAQFKAKLIQSPKSGKLHPPVETFKEKTISFSADSLEKLDNLVDLMIGKFKFFQYNQNSQQYELMHIRTAKGLSANQTQTTNSDTSA